MQRQIGERNTGLGSNQIKLIAIIAMTIDHIAWLLYPGCQHIGWVMGLHAIGRMTAPIMWFFMAEGFHYTRNVKKYIGRLFLFAFLSHFAYNLAGGIPFVPSGMLNQTSVMWPLAWSVVLMSIHADAQIKQWQKLLLTMLICLITFPADWSCIAVMAPLFLYAYRDSFQKQALVIVVWSAVYAVVYFFAVDKLYGLLQLCTALSIPILRQYNGKRGSWKGMKWLFYIYYPAHLLVIGILRLLMDIEGIFG